MRPPPTWFSTTTTPFIKQTPRIRVGIRPSSNFPSKNKTGLGLLGPGSKARSYSSTALLLAAQQRTPGSPQPMAQRETSLPSKGTASSLGAPPPPITHILETCLQVKDLKAATEFYQDVFNVQPFLNSPRMSGFSFAQTTLLLFQLGATAADSPMPDNRGTIPGHGPTQNVLDLLLSGTQAAVGDRSDQSSPSPSPASLHQHFCFAVQSPDDVGAWEKWFEEKDVKILGKVAWPRGGRSVYFADPDGNIGEVASRGIWEHY